MSSAVRTHQEVAQDVFDAVALHLLTQGQQSRGDTGACAYRGIGGRACALGALIKDEHYGPHLENVGLLHPDAVHISLLERKKSADLRQAVAESLEINPVFSFPVPSHPHQESLGVLLQRLQGIHDARRIRWWAKALRELAAEFGLEDRGLPS